MSELFQPAADFAQVVDGLATVTLKRPGGPASVAVDAALRRVVTTREAEASAGKYTTSDAVWLLDMSASSMTPQVGDRIVEADGARWTILSARREVAGARWRCHARRLAIENGPSELVTIERAAWSKGASGALAADWSVLAAGAPARIQPIFGAIDDDRNRRTIRVTHHVYLAQGIDLAESDRIVSLDGRCFLVVGFERPERIDELLIAHVQQQPPGAEP
jgi:hypothetical protein